MRLLATYLVLAIGLLIYPIWKWINNQKPIQSLFITLSPYRKYRKWIEAQARLETGNYTSRLFHEQNNLFGMKNAYHRKQLGTQVIGTDFRKYNSIGESIRDYLMRLEQMDMPTNFTNESDFVQYLGRNKYFGNEPFTSYLAKLRQWI